MMVRVEHDGTGEKAAHDARMDAKTKGVVRMIKDEAVVSYGGFVIIWS